MTVRERQKVRRKADGAQREQQPHFSQTGEGSGNTFEHHAEVLVVWTILGGVAGAVIAGIAATYLRGPRRPNQNVDIPSASLASKTR
ncbi:MAG TPA: hypothetical protein VN736_27365 [Candidatus Limnocylindrales bacterium]|nr:hypothetical protein [Candidatus Limnocylindrales bacterium]